MQCMSEISSITDELSFYSHTDEVSRSFMEENSFESPDTPIDKNGPRNEAEKLIVEQTVKDVISESLAFLENNNKPVAMRSCPGIKDGEIPKESLPNNEGNIHGNIENENKGKDEKCTDLFLLQEQLEIKTQMYDKLKEKYEKGAEIYLAKKSELEETYKVIISLQNSEQLFEIHQAVLKEENEKLKMELEKMHSISVDTESIAELKLQIGELDAKLKLAQNKNDSLEEEVNHKKGDIERFQDSIVVYENKIKLLQNEMSEMKNNHLSDLDKLQNEREEKGVNAAHNQEDCANESEQFRIKNDENTTKLDGLKEVIKHLQEQVADKTQNLQSISQSFEDLKTKNNNEDELHKSTVTSFEEFKQKNQDLRQKDISNMRTLEERIDILVNRNKELSKMLEEAGGNSNVKRVTFSDDKTETDSTERMKTLQKENIDMKKKFEETKTINEALTNQIQRLSAKMTDVTGEIKDIQKAELENLKSENKKNTVIIKDNQEKMLALTEIIEKHKEQSKTANKKISGQSAELTILRNKLDEETKKNSQLEAKLESNISEHKSTMEVKKQEGIIANELAALGARCRGERHEDTISRQREALSELRSKTRTQGNNTSPENTQVFQQVIALKRELAEARATHALAEQKAVLQSSILKEYKEEVQTQNIDYDIRSESSELEKIGRTDSLPSIHSSSENRTSYSNVHTLDQKNGKKSPTNSQSYEEKISKETGGGDTFRNNYVYSPKPPENSFSKTKSKSRSSSSLNSQIIAAGNSTKYEDVQSEIMNLLDLSEETFLDLVHAIAEALEISNLPSPLSLSYAPQEDQSRICSHRKTTCDMMSHKITSIKDKLNRKDNLLQNYEVDLHKLRQTEYMMDAKDKQIEDLRTNLQLRNEEIQYLRDSSERTKDKYQQEMRLNHAIKNKKTFHMENEKPYKINQKIHSCNDANSAFSTEKKDQQDKMKKKRYELKILKSELVQKEQDLYDTRRSLDLLKNTTSLKNNSLL